MGTMTLLLSVGLPIVIVVVTLLLVLPRVLAAFGGPKFKGQPIPGTAQVIAIQPTGSSIQRGGMPPAYSCQIALRVQTQNGQPYDVTISQYVDSMVLPSVRPGTPVNVQIDSANPQNVHAQFS